MREDMCIMLAALQGPGRTEVDPRDRRENLMSAGQSRHVDGDVRMAFDTEGNILAADIDFSQDIGSYPTPYPVLTTAAIGMFFPARTGCRNAASTTRRCSPTPPVCTPTAAWQYETLSREILLDIAARQLQMDPVELRRRNILRGDEMLYVNPERYAV